MKRRACPAAPIARRERGGNGGDALHRNDAHCSAIRAHLAEKATARAIPCAGGLAKTAPRVKGLEPARARSFSRVGLIFDDGAQALALVADRLEQFLDLVRRKRLAEVITLHFVAIVVAQERHLLVRFDAFGDDPQIELLAQGNHRAGDGPVVLVGGKTVDERFVDLQPRDRERSSAR